MMLTTWHVRKQALLIWAGRSHHPVPAGFNVNVGYCGASCEELLRAFQHAQGITADGKWGPVTEQHMEAFLHPPEPTPSKDARQRYLAEWWWALAADLNYKSVHGGATAFPYLERRPYSSLSYWQEHLIPMAGYDCSSSTVAAAHRAGRKDPTGMGYGGYGNCHEPSARLLTADLRWVAAGDVEVGDRLWAFDADANAGIGRRRARRYRETEVVASFLAEKECVRVCLDTGETLVCSVDHPWLAYSEGKANFRWTRACDLLNVRIRAADGHRLLVRPFLPWRADTSYESGWLAGMFDGEGWVTSDANREGRTGILGVCQVLGPTATRLETLAKSYGDFRTNVREAPRQLPNSQRRMEMISNGRGIYGIAEFLGRVRPERLIENFTLEGGTVKAVNRAEVVAVESVGMRQIQSIQTESGTYFAEGFAVHNTQSMIDHLPHRQDVAHCVAGDLVVFGGEMALQHVVTVAQAGSDPMVFSHGGPGIGHWPLSWETPAHLFQPIIPLVFD